MNFEEVIRRLVNALEGSGVSDALIGGFAMALGGMQRATVDLDFILMLEHLELADRILVDCGYARVFRSENVSHYEVSVRPEGLLTSWWWLFRSGTIRNGGYCLRSDCPGGHHCL